MADDTGCVAKAPGAVRESFGQLSDGRRVEAITLANGRGLAACIISYGAAIQSLHAPDRDGHSADVALGYASIDGYVAGTEYFGVTVGRVANRIANGRFTLDGVSYQTPVNNGVNALHGGSVGFDKALWEVVDIRDGRSPGVTLRHVSPDGDQGYPGTLTVVATYWVDAETNMLSVEYRATTDAPTVVNLTNHAYWNLQGEGSASGAMGHLLTIPAELYTPADAGAVPTGELRPVEGTPFDFRLPTPVGARVRDASDEQIRFGKGYDHNWVVDRETSAHPRLVARVEEPVTGRVLEIHSNQPGVQFYSGNFLDGSVAGKSGRLYRQGDALALEPQMFPDTPNRPEFGSVRLDSGETYRNVIEFRFSTSSRR
ncbi:MAG: galactose mutarotase [Pseudomonadota bacterium]|nr:galactose mutarotase [Pseudomonadota bacterium]